MFGASVRWGRRPAIVPPNEAVRSAAAAKGSAMLQAMRVPVARCSPSPIVETSEMITRLVAIARRSGTRSPRASAGTIANPPPTPKSPVSNPVERPAAATTARSMSGHGLLVSTAAPFPRRQVSAGYAEQEHGERDEEWLCGHDAVGEGACEASRDRGDRERGGELPAGDVRGVRG